MGIGKVAKMARSPLRGNRTQAQIFPEEASNLDPGKSIAYPYDTSDTLKKMICRYEHHHRAQNVSFRKLVPWIKVGERATHYIHSYPGKLLPQIAHFFLAAETLTRPCDIVLDPFGGTGTVALEAVLAGRRAYYADVNPLAHLIARVKTHPLDRALLETAYQQLAARYASSGNMLAPCPSVVNIGYWYGKKEIATLSRIKSAIEKEKQFHIRDFYRVAFSATCRRVSRADPRMSVPVRTKSAEQNSLSVNSIDAWGIFNEQVTNNLIRMDSLVAMSPAQAEILYVGDDARSLRHPTDCRSLNSIRLRSNSVAMIMTSPPYASAQKYIRASSLNLGWLGLAPVEGLKPLENASIGREHFPKAAYTDCPKTGIRDADRVIKRIYKINPLRGMIAASFLNEMGDAVREMARVLKPDGHLLLVIGNNEVCGLPFKSSEYLAEFCEGNGLRLKLKLIDGIKSRGLMTKRNRTASVITREWILLFQKPARKKQD